MSSKQLADGHCRCVLSCLGPLYEGADRIVREKLRWMCSAEEVCSPKVLGGVMLKKS